MTQVAERPAEKTGAIQPAFYAPNTNGNGKKAAGEAARRGWPLIAVCGGAMAGTAWLPTNNPGLGFLLLGAEIILGIYAVSRLVAPNRR